MEKKGKKRRLHGAIGGPRWSGVSSPLSVEIGWGRTNGDQGANQAADRREHQQKGGGASPPEFSRSRVVRASPSPWQTDPKGPAVPSCRCGLFLWQRRHGNRLEWGWHGRGGSRGCHQKARTSIEFHGVAAIFELGYFGADNKWDRPFLLIGSLERVCRSLCGQPYPGCLSGPDVSRFRVLPLRCLAISTLES